MLRVTSCPVKSNPEYVITHLKKNSKLDSSIYKANLPPRKAHHSDLCNKSSFL